MLECRGPTWSLMTGAANDSPINIRNEEMAKNERRIFVKVRKVNREKY